MSIFSRLGGVIYATGKDALNRARGLFGEKIGDESGKLAHTRRPRRTLGSVVPQIKEPTYILPPFPVAYRDMFNLSDLQPVNRTCKMAVRNETFRNGGHWVPRYTAKCPTCNIEFEKKHPDEQCTRCKGKLEAPDPTEYAVADEFFKCVNLNHQSLTKLLMHTDEDVSVVDQGFIVCRFEYKVDEEGNITERKIKEMVRGSPILMRIVADEKAIPGGFHYVCPVHRDMVLHTRTKDADFHEGPEWIETFEGQSCPKCGRKLYDVHYVSLRNEGGEIEEYFIEGEVIDYKVYSTSLTYGMPPMLTLWVPASALLFQEVYMRDYFERRRSPSFAILLKSGNPDSMLNMWDKVMERLKRDHHYVPVIPVEPEPSGYQSGDINVVRFMDTLKEMEYIPAREEARQRICSFYGVSNVFMNESKGVGGKQVDPGKQLLVTNRTIRQRQNIYNKDVTLRITTEIFGIENWFWELNPNEERDKLGELQEEQMKVQIAQMMSTLDFDVDRSPDGDFLYRKITQEEMLAQQAMQMQMGMGQEGPEEANTKDKAKDSKGPGKPSDRQGKVSYSPNVGIQTAQGEEDTQKGTIYTPEFKGIKVSSPNPPSEGKWLKLDNFDWEVAYNIHKQLQSVPSKMTQPEMPMRKPAKLTPGQMPPKATAMSPTKPAPHDAPGFQQTSYSGPGGKKFSSPEAMGGAAGKTHRLDIKHSRGRGAETAHPQKLKQLQRLLASVQGTEDQE